ncbi:MAG: HlyD family efflux transporter periplasmic adaptor subunit [Chryseobacterium sp.]|nr:MAG: HlyD family efflux transporter periplasmic adaptor subunit [Chryseobacterium sp.]
MPSSNQIFQRNSEEIQEIITAVPRWIIRWGITVICAVLLTIIILSGIIQYPDIVKANLKINSTNAPKIVLAKHTGKLSNLLVEEGEIVEKNEHLAYFETTADPHDVMKLYHLLLRTKDQKDLFSGGKPPVFMTQLNLGEMQEDFLQFHDEYVKFLSTLNNGFSKKQIAYLEKELKNIKILKTEIVNQRKVQVMQFSNAQKEYEAYKKLYEKKVISRSEFTQQENLFLSSKYPMQQSDVSIINNTSSYIEKEKELETAKNSIAERNATFRLAVNQCISQCEGWLNKYVLRAPQRGKVSFAGIVQPNQNFTENQEIFIVDPGNTDFFGEVQIPQFNIGKVHKGAVTLIKVRGYPFEQYGMIKGRLSYISDVAYKDSVFAAKVTFEKVEQKDLENKIVLKSGMLADAEIVTRESSLLQKFFHSITKILNSH